VGARLVVPLLEHAGGAVRLADHPLLRVGHEQLRLLHVALEGGDDALAQARHVGGHLGAHQDGVGPLAGEPLAGLGVDAIGLVQHQQARALVGAELGQHLAGDLHLRGERRIRGVDHVEQQVAVARLVERRAEAGHEVVRELLDEADRVGDEDARDGLRMERAHGGVERREELVLHETPLPVSGASTRTCRRSCSRRARPSRCSWRRLRRVLASRSIEASSPAAPRCGRAPCGGRARCELSPAPRPPMPPPCRSLPPPVSRRRGAR
jgi:hypothetical protein